MDFLQFALEPINLPYTFPMILVLLFWLSTFVGVLDLGSIDIDLELDTDAEADVSVSGGLNNVLHFFHVGEVPIMIIISFWVLFAWVASVLTNFYLDNSSWGVAALVSIPILLSSLLLTKVICTPFVKFFSAISKEDDTEVVGKVCILKSTADSSNLGLAEVKLDNVTQSIYVMPQDAVTLQKGDKALILMKKEDKNCYVVEPYHK